MSSKRKPVRPPSQSPVRPRATSRSSVGSAVSTHTNEQGALQIRTEEPETQPQGSGLNLLSANSPTFSDDFAVNMSCDIQSRGSAQSINHSQPPTDQEQTERMDQTVDESQNDEQRSHRTSSTQPFDGSDPATPLSHHLFDKIYPDVDPGMSVYSPDINLPTRKYYNLSTTLPDTRTESVSLYGDVQKRNGAPHFALTTAKYTHPTTSYGTNTPTMQEKIQISSAVREHFNLQDRRISIVNQPKPPTQFNTIDDCLPDITNTMAPTSLAQELSVEHSTTRVSGYPFPPPRAYETPNYSNADVQRLVLPWRSVDHSFNYGSKTSRRCDPLTWIDQPDKNIASAYNIAYAINQRAPRHIQPRSYLSQTGVATQLLGHSSPYTSSLALSITRYMKAFAKTPGSERSVTVIDSPNQLQSISVDIKRSLKKFKFITCKFTTAVTPPSKRKEFAATTTEGSQYSNHWVKTYKFIPFAYIAEPPIYEGKIVVLITLYLMDGHVLIFKPGAFLLNGLHTSLHPFFVTLFTEMSIEDKADNGHRLLFWDAGEASEALYNTTERTLGAHCVGLKLAMDTWRMNMNEDGTAVGPAYNVFVYLCLMMDLTWTNNSTSKEYIGIPHVIAQFVLDYYKANLDDDHWAKGLELLFAPVDMETEPYAADLLADLNSQNAIARLHGVVQDIVCLGDSFAIAAQTTPALQSVGTSSNAYCSELLRAPVQSVLQFTDTAGFSDPDFDFVMTKPAASSEQPSSTDGFVTHQHLAYSHYLDKRISPADTFTSRAIGLMELFATQVVRNVSIFVRKSDATQELILGFLVRAAQHLADVLLILQVKDVHSASPQAVEHYTVGWRGEVITLLVNMFFRWTRMLLIQEEYHTPLSQKYVAYLLTYKKPHMMADSLSLAEVHQNIAFGPLFFTNPPFVAMARSQFYACPKYHPSVLRHQLFTYQHFDLAVIRTATHDKHALRHLWEQMVKVRHSGTGPVPVDLFDHLVSPTQSLLDGSVTPEFQLENPAPVASYLPYYVDLERSPHYAVDATDYKARALKSWNKNNNTQKEKLWTQMKQIDDHYKRVHDDYIPLFIHRYNEAQQFKQRLLEHLSTVDVLATTDTLYDCTDTPEPVVKRSPIFQDMYSNHELQSGMTWDEFVNLRTNRPVIQPHQYTTVSRQVCSRLLEIRDETVKTAALRGPERTTRFAQQRNAFQQQTRAKLRAALDRWVEDKQIVPTRGEDRLDRLSQMPPPIANLLEPLLFVSTFHRVIRTGVIPTRTSGSTPPYDSNDPLASLLQSVQHTHQSPRIDPALAPKPSDAEMREIASSGPLVAPGQNTIQSPLPPFDATSVETSMEEGEVIDSQQPSKKLTELTQQAIAFITATQKEIAKNAGYDMDSPSPHRKDPRTPAGLRPSGRVTPSTRSPRNTGTDPDPAFARTPRHRSQPFDRHEKHRTKRSGTSHSHTPHPHSTDYAAARTQPTFEAASFCGTAAPHVGIQKNGVYASTFPANPPPLDAGRALQEWTTLNNGAPPTLAETPDNEVRTAFNLADWGFLRQQAITPQSMLTQLTSFVDRLTRQPYITHVEASSLIQLLYPSQPVTEPACIASQLQRATQLLLGLGLPPPALRTANAVVGNHPDLAMGTPLARYPPDDPRRHDIPLTPQDDRMHPYYRTRVLMRAAAAQGFQWALDVPQIRKPSPTVKPQVVQPPTPNAERQGSARSKLPGEEHTTATTSVVVQQETCGMSQGAPSQERMDTDQGEGDDHGESVLYDEDETEEVEDEEEEEEEVEKASESGDEQMEDEILQRFAEVRKEVMKRRAGKRAEKQKQQGKQKAVTVTLTTGKGPSKQQKQRARKQTETAEKTTEGMGAVAAAVAQGQEKPTTLEERRARSDVKRTFPDKNQQQKELLSQRQPVVKRSSQPRGSSMGRVNRRELPADPKRSRGGDRGRDSSRARTGYAVSTTEKQSVGDFPGPPPSPSYEDKLMCNLCGNPGHEPPQCMTRYHPEIVVPRGMRLRPAQSFRYTSEGRFAVYDDRNRRIEGPMYERLPPAGSLARWKPTTSSDGKWLPEMYDHYGEPASEELLRHSREIAHGGRPPPHFAAHRSDSRHSDYRRPADSSRDRRSNWSSSGSEANARRSRSRGGRR